MVGTPFPSPLFIVDVISSWVNRVAQADYAIFRVVSTTPVLLVICGSAFFLTDGSPFDVLRGVLSSLNFGVPFLFVWCRGHQGISIATLFSQKGGDIRARPGIFVRVHVCCGCLQ